MYLVRYRDSGGQPRAGLLEDGQVRLLPGITSLADLLAMPVLEVRAMTNDLPPGGTRFHERSLLAPIDGRT